MKSTIILMLALTTLSASAQNIGINNPVPLFPLSFDNQLGDKISLWSNSSNTYGLGIQSYLLQIYTDNPQAAIAFGSGMSSAFLETMRIKGTGAIAFNGNSGLQGQVLQSNGPVNAPTWVYPNAHYIGEAYGGGIVFYVYDNGLHGLIAATADQGFLRWYGGSPTNTRARADGVGAGKANTAICIANQVAFDGNPFAASACNEYSVVSNSVTYGDWYLPSKHELNLLYQQRNVVGGFIVNTYYSSTEIDNQSCWAQSFFDGSQFSFLKGNQRYVRAIRAF